MKAAEGIQQDELYKRTWEPFRQTLFRHGLRLTRGKTTILQVNVGLLCNQKCRHCHLGAGPGWVGKENMDSRTVRAVIAYAERSVFETIDITGGAPELNPNVVLLIQELSHHTRRLILRSNLSALEDGSRDELIELLRQERVAIVASFPSLNQAQADSQRGNGIFQKSVDTLRKLNRLGYGVTGTGLELNLVSNPTGAFILGAQAQVEKRFREILFKKWGIVFNTLFTFANVPLGRFRNWLQEKGNLESYLERLASSFNPCAVDGLMCRTLVSVSWDGYLYDCDFNLAENLCMGRSKTHVSEMEGPPLPGSPIAVDDHCYTCTAGAGFT